VPEEGASEAKVPTLANFYIGVVELFAVLIPGAILSFLLIPWLPLDALPQAGKIVLTPTVRWVAFAIAAYGLGHFLFSLGALAMDPIYDLSYKDRSRSFRKRREAIYHELETSPEFGRLGFKRGTGDNALDWTLAILTFRLPGAFAQLDRLEADSKFLRSLVLILLFSSPLLQDKKATPAGILVTAYIVIAACLWALNVLSRLMEESDRRKAKERKRETEEERKMREAQEYSARLLISSVVVAFFVVALAVILFIFGYKSFMWYWLSSSVLAILAAVRFMQLRQKRTRLAYELLLVSLAAEGQNAPSGPRPASTGH